jgi:predicted RNase H-like nuclease
MAAKVDGVARRITKPRTSTIFAVPTRQAVYECHQRVICR